MIEQPVTEKKDEKVLDVSNINPEKDFMCFGTIETSSQECIECLAREKCAKKAGIEL